MINLPADRSSMNLLVIGGAAGMGNWLVRRVFGKLPEISRIALLDVISVDEMLRAPSVDEMKALSKSVELIQADYSAQNPLVSSASLNGDSPVLKSLDEYNAVMIAVPRAQFRLVSESLLPQLSPSAWVFDICSEKVGPLQELGEHLPDGCSLVGTHPLFGPIVHDLVGQLTLLVKTDRSDEVHFNWLRGVFKAGGALVNVTDGQTHDQYMLYVQCLTHFMYLSFGSTLAAAMRRDFEFDESFDFMTPPYAAAAGFLGRVLASNPRTYAQVQGLPGAEEIRASFVNAATELAETFRDSNESERKDTIAAIANPFPGQGVSHGVSLSGVYVDATQRYFRELQARCQDNSLTVIERKDFLLEFRDPRRAAARRKYHAGKVVEFDQHSLTILERRTRKNGRHIVVYDPESEISARSLGLPPSKHSEEIKIWHKHARILDEEELRAWRAENLLNTKAHISCVVASEFPIRELADVAPRLFNEFIRIDVVEADATWLQQFGLRNVVLEAHVFGDKSLPSSIRKLEGFLTSLGVRLEESPGT